MMTFSLNVVLLLRVVHSGTYGYIPELSKHPCKIISEARVMLATVFSILLFS